MSVVIFENSTAATNFFNSMAHVTYRALKLGKIFVGDDDNDDDNEEKKIEHLRIISELIKPSVEQLTVDYSCQIEVLDVLEECATITQIQWTKLITPIDFPPPEIQPKLQTIAARNVELARFVANPPAYPGSDLLALMSKFDSCPTGRYMLACSFAGMPSFFKI